MNYNFNFPQGNNGYYTPPNYYQSPQPYNQQMFQNQQRQMYQQPMQQSQSTQLIFLENFDNVKSYIVTPNNSVFLKDTSTNTIYEKIADNMGNYKIVAYKIINENESQNNNEYVLRSDLNSFINDFEQKLNIISSQVEKLNRTQISKQNNQNKGVK